MAVRFVNLSKYIRLHANTLEVFYEDNLRAWYILQPVVENPRVAADKVHYYIKHNILIPVLSDKEFKVQKALGTTSYRFYIVSDKYKKKYSFTPDEYYAVSFIEWDEVASKSETNHKIVHYCDKCEYYNIELPERISEKGFKVAPSWIVNSKTVERLLERGMLTKINKDYKLGKKYWNVKLLGRY